MSLESGHAADGSLEAIYVLENISSTPCSLSGYPAVAFYSTSTPASSSRISVKVIDTAAGGLSSTGIVIAHGAKAGFAVQFAAIGSQACHAVQSVEITLPAPSSSVPLVGAGGYELCVPSVEVTPILTMNGIASLS